MRRALLFSILFFAAGAAEAQTPSVMRRTAGSGLDLPGTSVALEDGPSSSVVNPAGLAMQPGLGLRYMHEEGVGGEEFTSVDGDGLYFGLPILGFLGFGVALEWLEAEPRFLPSHRRTTWSLALGDRRFALGASAHVFSGGVLDDSTSWDLGLLARPSRALSLGFSVRDVDATRFQGGRLSREYILGLGLRPLGDWLTLSVDAAVLGGENDDLPHGFDSTAFGGTLLAEVLPGLTLLGGYIHRLDIGAEAVHFGLRLDSGALRVEGAPILRTEGKNHVGWVAGAMLQARRDTGLGTIGGHRYARVRLDPLFSSPTGFAVFGGAPRDPLVDAVEGLAALGRDEKIDGVLLDLQGPLPIGMGNAWELHRSILELRARGKRVVAYLEGADDATYLVAAAADRVVASPPATFTINGFAARADFLRNSLDAIGIHVDAVRIGTYKNAPEALTRSSISESHREVVNDLLDDVFSRYVAALAQNRGLGEAEVKERLGKGLRSATSAREAGLVDELAYRDELESYLREFAGRRVAIDERALRPPPWTHWSNPPEIAVIPITGTIVSGPSQPFGFVPTTGDRSVIQALERASRDPSIRAILLRIDSGGGDAAASQRIWRAVQVARRHKPVIAAMGDAAASGGYFAAVGADRIFANPGTYTGSIGVFWLKPNLEGLMEKLKVGSYSSKRGEEADILSWRAEWTEGMRESVEAAIHSFYEDFLEATAEARGLEVDEVDAIAQGRVWTGGQAEELGLVDELGGLGAALRAARREAGLDEDAIVRFRLLAPSPSFLSLSASSGSALEGPLGSLLRATVPIPILLWNGTGMWALSPIAWWSQDPARL